MGQALYRKYRSKRLSEIVGQEHITRTLERALKTGKISHAYLFTGPRGVGKTSIARILAHELNDLPYTDESMHLDIIEIDAASNRRIDEIRDLRDKVHIAPTSAKYKVYIIDEVHMLTKEAFNALLKTLEEPPAHVIFILATTELHKLPETIISRTQRFTFKAIDETDAVGHLRTIAISEGMDIEDDALKLLATQANGSFRDSISLLDQVGHSGKKITKADAEKLVGIAAKDHIESLLHATLEGKPKDILSALDALVADGINPSQVAKQLGNELRKIVSENKAGEIELQMLGDLLDVSQSSHPSTKLEVVLFAANLRQHGSSQPARKPATSRAAETTAIVIPAEVKEKQSPAPETMQSNKTKTVEIKVEPKHVSVDSADWWDEVLNTVKQANNTLYGILRMAQTALDNDTLHLSFGFGFHKKKIDDATTQAKLRDAIKSVTGKSYKIVTFHDPELSKQSKNLPKVTDTADRPKPIESNEELDSITNIFGGAEVLES